MDSQGPHRLKPIAGSEILLLRALSRISWDGANYSILGEYQTAILTSGGAPYSRIIK